MHCVLYCRLGLYVGLLGDSEILQLPCVWCAAWKATRQAQRMRILCELSWKFEVEIRRWVGYRPPRKSGAERCSVQTQNPNSTASGRVELLLQTTVCTIYRQSLSPSQMHSSSRIADANNNTVNDELNDRFHSLRTEW